LGSPFFRRSFGAPEDRLDVEVDVSEELLRLVDSIHRDKGVNKDVLFKAVEEALSAAAKKRYKSEGNIVVTIDRLTGEIAATEDEGDLDLTGFGRIAARTAYQVMTQRIREAERDVVFDDFEAKIDTLVTGTVQRFERGAIVVNLGRSEGILPRQEQVFNETYRAGDRIRAYILSVKKKGQKVVIILSRTHPNLVKELFALEIPEVSDRIVEIKNVVREPGFRTKVAVSSNDPRVDPQGACIGVRGTRIRNVVDELNGERIDIIPWNESLEIFIKKALSPAEISMIELDRDAQRARAIVPEDQLSLAIGKRGQNVRLAARLTGWHIDILPEEEARREKEAARAEMQRLSETIEGLTQSTVDTLMLSGFGSLHAIAKKGPEKLATVKGLDEAQSLALWQYAAKRIEELAEEKARRASEERVAAAEARAREATLEAEGPAPEGGGETAEVPAEASEETGAAEDESESSDEADESESDTSAPEQSDDGAAAVRDGADAPDESAQEEGAEEAAAPEEDAGVE
jgi:N utilization substance protein A